MGHEHHPLAVLRSGFQQIAIGLEPPQDVLGQLDAVDTPDHLPVLHDLLERRERRVALRRRGGGADVGRIGRERRHERRRVELGEGVGRGPEVVGPPLAVEAAGAVGRQPGEELVDRGLGQRAQPHRRREGRVVEVHAGRGPAAWRGRRAATRHRW